MSQDYTDALLKELKEEREKFTKANDEKMEHLVALLVLAGVYPAISNTGFDALAMVNGWGAYWHQWSEPLQCPECKADLRDHVVGPPFKREIQVIPNRTQEGRYYIECPDCKCKLGQSKR